jgi:uncharacterized surface protein with fasciclin (FAS1) repeats
MKKIGITLRKLSLFFCLSMLAWINFSCSDTDKEIIKPNTIADVLQNNADFTIFNEIIHAAGLEDALRTENITLFAPNDAAFRSSNILNASVVTSLPQESIVSFVNYHILGQKIDKDDFTPGIFKALNHQNLDLSLQGTEKILAVNRAYTTKMIKTDNGVMYIVDRTVTIK